MNTLIVGHKPQLRKLIGTALQRRNFFYLETDPSKEGLDLIGRYDLSLIILSDYSEEALWFCKQVRNMKNGWRYTIYAVIEQDETEHLPLLLEAGIDQYIIESLFNEQRLDIRLSFAERLSQSKRDQFLTGQQLKESEAMARSILDTTVDAIITIDDQAIIKSYNISAERLFLYTPDEVLGKNVKILMPEPYRREHDDYIQNYHNTGNKKIIGIGREVMGRRKDGSTFPMYLAVSEVNVNNQRIYTGIIRDITENRRLEQEVLRISEHERHRIGQDLHDGLGQMLTGITLINKSIFKKLEEQEHPLASNVEEVTGLLKEADEFARGLSRNLIPVELESNGLIAALHRLIQNAKRLFNIECSLENPLQIHFSDPTAATHLFRIIQEATSNAVKHGDASNVRILMDCDDSRLIIRIEDNGSGFSDTWDTHKGLGVRIMKFRSRLIGATLDITDSPMGGADIVITLLKVRANYSIIGE